MERVFPKELFDHISDDVSLDGDITTLSACTLVCHSWLPRASKYLFQHRTVEAGTLPVLELLATTLKLSERLKVHISAVRIFLREDAADDVQRAVECVVDVVSSLPALANLTVDSHPRVHDSLEQREPLFPAHPVHPQTLRCLSLTRAHVILTDGLMKLFPAVETLELKDWPGRASDRPVSQHTVRQLVFRSEVDTSSLPHIAQLLAPPGVSALSIELPGVLNLRSPANVSLLVGAFGRRITHLEYRQRAPTRIMNPIGSIPKCTQLESVALFVNFRHWHISAGNPLVLWLDCLRILLMLPEQVRRIRFTIEMRQLHSASADPLPTVLDWKLLEQAVGESAALEAVELVLLIENAQNAPMRVDWEDEVRAAVGQKFSPQFRALTRISFE